MASIKQVVNSEKDCQVMASAIHEIFLPNMKARGVKNPEAILNKNTKCIPVSGASAKDEN